MLVRMTVIKKARNNKCWQGGGEKGTLVHCWWECKSVQPSTMENSIEAPQKIKNSTTKQFHFWIFIQKKEKK